MAIGKGSDFKIYEEQFYGGLFEGIAQIVDGFNASSNGAIRLVQQALKANYEKESFFKDISGLIAHRDITSVAAATDLAMTQGEFVGVKIARGIGPVAQTLDAWRKLGKDSKEMSFQLGKIIAGNKAKDYINTVILAVETALAGQATLNYDGTAGTMSHTTLVNGMALMGDYAGQIVMFVMHSKVYFDLMKQAIADKVFEVAGATIYNGNVATFGRPVLVIDSPALYDANGSAADSYNTLGLVTGAVTLKESEEQEIYSEVVTGLKNLVYRVQGEYAYNIEVKGLAWDVTNGGTNPTDATLGTTTNWDLAVGDVKNGPGVRIVTD